jgi:K+-transporting ATPase KdpF subunit
LPHISAEAETMTPLYWIGLIVASALFIYLLFAMLKPESMQ